MTKEILPLATTGMNPEGIMLGVTSQTEKDKQYGISCTCRLKKSIPWKERIQWELPVAGVGGNGEILVKVYKLPVTG